MGWEGEERKSVFTEFCYVPGLYCPHVPEEGTGAGLQPKALPPDPSPAPAHRGSLC